MLNNRLNNIYQFLEEPRTPASKKVIQIRKTEFVDIYNSISTEHAKRQASRCLACGNPYCQYKCPLHNNIPDWLSLAKQGRIIEAAELAHLTNSLPEVCGKVCPQDRLCEGSCTLNAEFGAVTIGAVENYITEQAFAQGWRPQVKQALTTKTVAIIGAGPAGLGCADWLIRQGVAVTVYDRHPEIGGLLTFGIPTFKLEKQVLTRRREIFTEMGIEFKLGYEIGQDLNLTDIVEQYDAVFLAVGTYKNISANIPNEQTQGVFPALPFLIANTKKVLNLTSPDYINVANKKVVVLGGGDTAMDCVRTSVRQGASQVTCVYRRDEANMPGSKKEVLNAKEEGVDFFFNAQPEAVFIDGKAIAVKKNSTDQVKGITIIKTRLGEPDENGRRKVENIPNSEELIECDIILTAFGFAPHRMSWLADVGVSTDSSGKIVINTQTQQTANPKIFAGGDITRGSDLVVTAIADGHQAANGILDYLNI